jgi:hypothetical protein
MLNIKAYKKIIIFGLTAAIAVSVLTGCAGNNNGGENIAATTAGIQEPGEAGTDIADNTEEPEEVIIAPRFNQYALPEEEPVEPHGFRGTMHVVIGKNGYLYENGYINEYTGAAPKYINVTDAELINRAEVLKDIQYELEARGIAFCVVITPSKASQKPQFIPDFHLQEFPPLTAGYIRPYIRFRQFLQDAGVYFIDSATVYESIGMTNTFPRTGIHWNLMAAFETADAVVREYERQRGFEVRRLIAESIISSPTPIHGNEQDIFGIVYSGRNRDYLEDAIIDERYYAHDIYLERGGKPKIGRTIIQGGSFTGELGRFFSQLAESTASIYYNNGGEPDRINWGRELGSADFILLEVNEQFVYNMGGNAPQWGEQDFMDLPAGANFIDALWEYLANNP